MRTKLILLLVGVAAVAILAGCQGSRNVNVDRTMADENVNENANAADSGQTYSNQTYKFSFSFPADWFKRECSSSDLGTDNLIYAIFLDPDQASLPVCESEGIAKFSLVVPDANAEGYSASDYIKTLKEQLDQAKSEEITIGNIKGTKITGLAKAASGGEEVGPAVEAGSGVTEIIFKADDRNYRITYYGEKQDAAALDLIINSFQFTK